MMKASTRLLLSDTAVALAVAVVVLGLRFLGAFDFLEHKSLDLRFRLRGRVQPHRDIVMVDIADDAVREFDGWPLARQFHALFISAVHDLGVSQVIYDLSMGARGDSAADAFLGETVAEAGNVVFPLWFAPEESPDHESGPTVDALADRIAFRKCPDMALPSAGTLMLPVEDVARNCRAMGFINVEPDPDGVCRRVAVATRFRGRCYPQLCLPAIAAHWGVDPRDVRLEPGRGLVFAGARIDSATRRDVVVPLDRQGNILINWVGGWKDIPHLSFRDILVSYKLAIEGGEPPVSLEELRQLAGKILVVGVTRSQTRDIDPIPFDRVYPMPGLHFNVVNTILTRSFIRQLPPAADVAIVLLICLLLCCSTHFSSPALRHVLFGVSVVGIMALSMWLFVDHNVWFRTVEPLAVSSLTFVSLLFTGYLHEARGKRQVRGVFQRYMSRDVMEQLLESTGGAMPGGQKREVTVLFTDIRGSTALMESQPAERVVELLNEFLDAMTEVIFSFNGTVDKFIGDAVMAYFGAPLHSEDHAKRAVHAAVVMRERARQLEAKWQAEGRPVIRAGTGIATGEVVMGNVGSKRFMDFTLIGDTVNVASRLSNAALAGQILITEATFLETRHHAEILTSERIQVKGKSQPVRTYAVAGYADDAEGERRRHRRSEAQLDILVKVLELDDTYQKVLVNISGGGFRMVGKRWIKPKSEILATIPLPTGVEIRDAPGVVLSGENTQEGLVETRVSFTGLPERDRDEIVKFVYRDYTV